MTWIPAGVRRAFRLPGRTAAEHETLIDAELEFHLAMRAAEYEAAGMSAEEARLAAQRKFGDVDDARRYCRGLDEAHGRTRRRRDWRAGWAHDVRSATRQLRAAPGVTLAAVLTLALGIGATTALYSVVHKLLVAPLPYADGDRLVSLMSTQGGGNVLVTPSPALLDAWRTARTLERLETYATIERTRTDGAEPELIQGVAMSPGMPALLGVRPVLGRPFRADEAAEGATPVALLGYGYWQRAFGGADDVVGRTVMLDRVAHTVVGVLPRDFVLPFDDGVARPIVVPHVVRPSAHGVGTIVARLRPGVTAEAASAELTAIVARMLADGDPNVHDRMGARAWSTTDAVGSGTRDMLLVLLAATGVVLLIACANVAGLLLARAAARQRELAVRAALGAGRWRIVRQLLVESALLGTLGGVAGLAVAWSAVRLVVGLRPPSLDELAGLQPQPMVLGAALLLAVLTGLAFGLAPALFAAEHGAAATLTGASRTSTGQRRSQRLRATLVAVEVALSVVLLVGAGLLLRSVQALNAVDVGFDARGLTAMSLQWPEERYEGAARADLVARTLAAVRRVPGVRGAITSSGVPPRAGLTMGSLEIEGRALAGDERLQMIGYAQVGPDHFRFLGLPLRDGRIAADTAGSTVVVNEAFARRYWPDGRAVGQRIRMDPSSPWQTIAGVVGDVRIPNGGPMYDFQLYAVGGDGGIPGQTTLVLRVADGAGDAMGAVTRAVLAIDPSLKLRNVFTIEQAIDERLAGPRFSMTLLVAFAALALVLAAVGLYGVIAYAVTQRTREIGVRIALGARPQRVVGLVVRQAALLAGIGVALGLGGAAAATRVLGGMLYGVTPLDAPTFAVVAALLLAVALLAAFAPARRAARVDPAIALRAE